jgi:hypothetical protein
MKKSIAGRGFALSLLAVLVGLQAFSGCWNLTEEDGFSVTGRPAGGSGGLMRISLGEDSSSVRTVMPSLGEDFPTGRTIMPSHGDFDKLRVRLYNNSLGKPDFTVELEKVGGVFGNFAADPGKWDIHIVAMYAGLDVAEAEVTGFTVKDGEVNVVNVALTPVKNGGRGNFFWKIDAILESDAEVHGDYEILSFDTGEKISGIILFNREDRDVSAGGNRNLDVGQYGITFHLFLNGERSVYQNICHIFNGLESRLDLFYEPLTPLWKLVLASWTGSRWDFFDHQVRTGHLKALGSSISPDVRIGGFDSDPLRDLDLNAVTALLDAFSEQSSPQQFDIPNFRFLTDAALVRQFADDRPEAFANLAQITQEVGAVVKEQGNDSRMSFSQGALPPEQGGGHGAFVDIGPYVVTIPIEAPEMFIRSFSGTTLEEGESEYRFQATVANLGAGDITWNIRDKAGNVVPEGTAGLYSIRFETAGALSDDNAYVQIHRGAAPATWVVTAEARGSGDFAGTDASGDIEIAVIAPRPKFDVKVVSGGTLTIFHDNTVVLQATGENLPPGKSYDFAGILKPGSGKDSIPLGVEAIGTLDVESDGSATATITIEGNPNQTRVFERQVLADLGGGISTFFTLTLVLPPLDEAEMEPIASPVILKGGTSAGVNIVTTGFTAGMSGDIGFSTAPGSPAEVSGVPAGVTVGGYLTGSLVTGRGEGRLVLTAAKNVASSTQTVTVTVRTAFQSVSGTFVLEVQAVDETYVDDNGVIHWPESPGATNYQLWAGTTHDGTFGLIKMINGGSTVDFDLKTMPMSQWTGMGLGLGDTVFLKIMTDASVPVGDIVQWKIALP